MKKSKVPSKKKKSVKKSQTTKSLSAKKSKKNHLGQKKFKSSRTFSEGLSLLKHYYPDAHCALHFENAFQLLLATILSAQCTDERVNMVTPILFENYPSPEVLAKAPILKIEEIIRSTGFYKNKAKSLVECSRAIVERHGGEVPKDLESLVQLAGVGRKTANVVLGNAFGITSGVVVDTHVSRLSQRLGWTSETTPEKIELDLADQCPREDWIMLSHYLISHGRAICKARSPLCAQCFLSSICEQNGV